MDIFLISLHNRVDTDAMLLQRHCSPHRRTRHDHSTADATNYCAKALLAHCRAR